VCTPVARGKKSAILSTKCIHAFDTIPRTHSNCFSISLTRQRPMVYSVTQHRNFTKSFFTHRMSYLRLLQHTCKC